MDKTVRIVLGLVLLAVGFFAGLSSLWTVIVLVLAGIAFVTAFAGFCPLNRLLGINTCQRETI